MDITACAANGRVPMKRLFVPSVFVLACLTPLASLGAPASAVTQFTVTAQVLAAGTCDATAALQFSVGPVDPFTNVGVSVDYPRGDFEGAAGPANVQGNFSGLFTFSGGSPLI